MKLVILRSNLLTALARTAPIAKQKSTMPVLSTVLIRAAELQPLTISVTNLQQSVTTRAPADVATSGAACVSARDLHDRVKTFPEGPITVTLDATHLHLVAGKRKHRLSVINPDEFPTLAPAPEGGLTLPSAALSTVLEQTRHAAGEDPDRANIHGVFLEFAENEIRATATDGRRVHFASQPVPGATVKPGVILPIASVDAILAILDDSVTIGMSGYELAVRSGDTTFTTKLVEAQFPPAREFLSRMPQDGLSLDRDQLADALTSVAQGSGSGALAGILTLTVEGDELKVSGKESEDTLSLPPSSPHAPVPPASLQSSFLLRALATHLPGIICLRLPLTPLDPIFLTAPDPAPPHSPIAIVMPCRA